MAPIHIHNGSSSGDESSSGNVSVNKGDYVRKRQRNNDAVKKSRLKSKEKLDAMKDRVNKLRSENDKLEENIKIHSREIGILKDLFLAHPDKAHGTRLNEKELSDLLRDVPEINENINLLMDISKKSPAH